MKILLLPFAAMFIFFSHAQEEPHCIHNVSTDFENPTNDDLPINLSAPYLNGFDWIPYDDINNMLMGYTCVNMSFGGVTIPNMNSIMSSSLSHYDYIDDGPLMANENGWELMLVNLGRFPDDISEVDTPANNFSANPFYSMPYIVIYNRYSGILRVFFSFGLDATVGDGADAVEVMVSFKDASKMSGLLRLNEGTDQSLDQNSDVQYVRSHAKAPAATKQWASTDFQLAYDPCTCFYPSNIKLDFYQTKTSTIDLVGRSVTLPDEPLINNTTLQTNPTEFLTGYDFDGSKDAKGGGLVMHKSLDAMIENYLENYEKYNKELIAVGIHNAKVKKNIALLKMGLFVVRIIANPPAAVTGTLTAVQLAEQAFLESNTDLTGMTAQEVDEYFYDLGLQNLGWFAVVGKYYKGIMGANEAGKKKINQKALFEKIGEVFGEKGKTFIKQNFVAKKPPTKPTIPTATFSEMTYKGEITDQKDLGGPEFYTPGTYGSEGTGTPNVDEFFNYPVYNEILGSFALLKSPKVRIFENSLDYYTNQEVQTKLFNTGFYEVDIYNKKNWTTEYQFELDEELLYTMNPALDMTGFDISASFEIVATPKERDVAPDDATPSHAIINTFASPIRNVNLSVDNYDLKEKFPITTNGRPYNYYNSSVFGNTDFESEAAIPVVGHVVDNSNNRFQTIHTNTEYLPLDAFNPFRSSIGLTHQTVSHVQNAFWTYDLDDYDHTEDQFGVKIWDLSDPDFILPKDITLGYHSYEYDFKIYLKLLITMDYETLNSEGENNTVTQLLTYEVAPEDITRTPIGAINNLYYSGYNVSQFEKDLFFGNQPVNLGAPYEYKFYGQAVDGCTLNGNTYTCRAWNDVTILGDIIIANGYDVNFYAGNEVLVIGTSTVPYTANLEIKPVLDYSVPNPIAKQQQVYDFCTINNNDSPGYQANSAEDKFGEDVISDSEIDPENGFSEDWDFVLFPNPTHSSTTVQFLDAGDRKLRVECFDVTMKRMNLVEREGSSNEVLLTTDNLSPGVYIIKVSMNGGYKTKRLIVH
ncbi:MAG: hypothetical protein ACJA1C_002455 [Crocinitomicaceae bacterium]|jgi:hypothetical protein